MGGQQSKPIQDEKLAVAQLRRLTIEDSTRQHEYNESEKQPRKYVPSESSSLTVDTVEEWQHRLLQDPKNRSALIIALPFREDVEFRNVILY
jgi:hypothetical protein